MERGHALPRTAVPQVRRVCWHGVHSGPLCVGTIRSSGEGASRRGMCGAMGTVACADWKGRVTSACGSRRGHQGVVWAVWTFHYEEHLPAQCDRYTCFCGDGGKAGCPLGKCMPSSQYELDACPMHGPGYTEPCHNTTICDQVRTAWCASSCVFEVRTDAACLLPRCVICREDSVLGHKRRRQLRYAAPEGGA